MKTLSEVIAWLKQPDHIRVILLEITGVLVGGSPTSFYLSSKPFTSTGTDTPANTFYDPCILGSLSFTESLDLEGSPSIGHGDIEIENTAGIRDSWLNYVWANRDINIYIGDPRWSKADYYKIFSGVVSDILSRDRNKLNLVILDKLEKLNRPIYETTLGGTGNNKDRLKPLVFGECFNVQPLYTDKIPADLTYMVHDGPIENIIEVRDNGLSVLYTADLANGKFTLLRNPVGQITVSVQGAKPTTYLTKISDIIKHIVTTYGPIASRLTLSDINTANFSNHAATYTQAVGIYCKDRENILDICQRLANSIGHALVFDSQGLLKLVKLDIPGSGNTYTVYPEDIEFNSLAISDRSIVKAAIKLNYCRNWSPIDSASLAGAVPKEHVAVFESEWYTKEVLDSTIITNYKLNEENEAINTELITNTDISAEATRRLTLWKTPRNIVNFTGYAHLLPIELGDTVTIYNSRYNMSSGTSGTVINIERDWIAGRVNIGVLV